MNDHADYRGELDELLTLRERERRGPDAGEACEMCNGQDWSQEEWPPQIKECPRCLGTGVQP